jgi:hypothetical protein
MGLWRGAQQRPVAVIDGGGNEDFKYGAFVQLALGDAMAFLLCRAGTDVDGPWL